MAGRQRMAAVQAPDGSRAGSGWQPCRQQVAAVQAADARASFLFVGEQKINAF